MRFLPTRIHGVIDYVWGALAFASPWLFGWPHVGFGLFSVAASLITKTKPADP